MKPRLLLAEDDNDIRINYQSSLNEAGFEVISVEDGFALYDFLKKYKFQVILSDSELPLMDGYDSCRKALEDKLFDDSETLIVGMSFDSDNQQYWRGLAHLGCFYDKGYFPPNKIGVKIMQDLINFRSGGLWKSKMPKIEW